MGGGRIIPRSPTGNENFFKPRPTKIFWRKSQMTPLYFLKIVFPKFDPLTVTGMALQYVLILAQNVIIYSA